MTTVFDYTRTHAVRMAFLFSSHSQQSLKIMKSYTKYQMRRATILAASLVSRCRMWSWLRAWYVSRCMCLLCWCAWCATDGVFVEFSLQRSLKIMKSYANYTMRIATILAASLVPRWRTRNLKPLSVTAWLHCMLVLLPVKGAKGNSHDLHCARADTYVVEASSSSHSEFFLMSMNNEHMFLHTYSFSCNCIEL